MAEVTAASMAFAAVKCSAQRPSASASPGFDLLKPLWKDWQQQSPLQVDVGGMMKNASIKMLDALVDSLFKFVDQEYLPPQRNFAPIAELREAVCLDEIQGHIPHDFLTGVYIRNGPNPLFGGLKLTRSIFGRLCHTWIEGEGMLHAVYFEKDSDGKRDIVASNRKCNSRN